MMTKPDMEQVRAGKKRKWDAARSMMYRYFADVTMDRETIRDMTIKQLRHSMTVHEWKWNGKAWVDKDTTGRRNNYSIPESAWWENL